jgi:glycosyltransferase involved in cell wall biosynthesis
MKIAQIIPNLRVGGAEIMCENLAKALIHNKHEVFIVSLYDDETIITKRLMSFGIKIYFLHKKSGPDFGLIRRLVSILKSEKPDVVHAHLYAASYAMIAAVLSGCKSRILTIHSLAHEDNSVLGRLFNRILFHYANVIPVALSTQVQKTIIDQYKLPKEKVPIIYNGIDLDKCFPKSNYDLIDDFSILHVGRFSPVKNHETILNAFSYIIERILNAKLILVGEGELLQKAKDYASSKGLDSYVSFEGQQEDVYSYYCNADIFILPSIYEGMPMSIIEAMGSGLPIIASNVGGIKDMIDDGIDGLLIDPTTENLISAIVDLYESKDKRISMGKKAYVKSKEYSSKTMAEKYLQLYKGDC